MKRLLLTCWLMVLAVLMYGDMLIVVTDVPDYYTPLLDDIYVSGSFNNWSTNDPAYRLSTTSSGLHYVFISGVHGATYEYKLNRGDWSTVETYANGNYRPNRILNYIEGGTTYISIEQWEDMAVPHTAVGNTHIFDLSFYMPELGRDRRIWVYLPNDYYTSNRSYPVLYMHDGQNLFDEAYTFSYEWSIDENMDILQGNGHEPAIIVGIDNGGARRIDEYSPWLNPSYGGGEGDEYVDFLVNTLKPVIDGYFRTLPGRETTGIMGSSMGGLISFYAGLLRQDVFGRVGVFSPAFWIVDNEIFAFAQNTPKQYDTRFYFLSGGQEPSSMASNMYAMYLTLLSNGFSSNELYFEVPSYGAHSEWFWALEFYDAYVWLFDTPFLLQPNGVSNAQQAILPSSENLFEVYQTWGQPSLQIKALDLTQQEEIALTLYNSLGQPVQHWARVPERIDLNHLASGMYSLYFYSNNYRQAAKIMKH